MVVLRTLGTVELTDDTGRELQPILRQPKRLALLLYLALAVPRGFHRRDSLVALLWPELDQEHARAALRKTLFVLRQELGERAIIGRGDDELRLSDDVVWCDAVALVRALDAGEFAEAMALYRGDLLPGFHVAEASPGLSQWLEEERVRLRGRAAAGAWRLAEQREECGDVAGARDWANRAAQLEPLNESAARRLITTLDRMGDRAAAIRAYEGFARRLREELELAPSEETVALVQSLRGRAAPVSGIWESGDRAAALRELGDFERWLSSELELRPSPPFGAVAASIRAQPAGTPPSRSHVVGSNVVESRGSSTAKPPQPERPVRRRHRLVVVAVVTLVLVSGLLAGSRAFRHRPLPRATSEAMALFERGREYTRLGRERDRRENWTLAAEMFERATRAAPDFAAAHAALGTLHLRLFHWGDDRSTARQARAKAAIDRSLALDPNEPEAINALGWYYAWGSRDYERALAQGRRALQLRPDNEDAATLVFTAARRLGRAAEALPFIERAVALSRHTVSLRREMALTYVGLRNYPRAMQVLDSSLALFPDDAVLHAWKWETTLLATGSLASAALALQQAGQRLTRDATWRMEFDQLWLSRTYDGALAVLEREKLQRFHLQTGDFPIELKVGMIHRLAGRDEKAREAYRRAVPAIRSMIQRLPNDAWYHGWLAVALAGAGDRAAALEETELALDLAELTPDPWANPYLTQEVLLHALLLCGERERAIEALAGLLSSQYYGAISREWIRLDPRFDALRASPEFRRLSQSGGEEPSILAIGREVGFAMRVRTTAKP